MRGQSYVRKPEAGSLFLEAAVVQLGKQPLGEFGQLSPLLAKRYDLRDATLLAELNYDLLLARRNPSRSFKILTGVSLHSTRRRHVGAGSHFARSGVDRRQTGQAAESGERRTVRCFSREKYPGGTKEHGLRLHLSGTWKKP